MFLDRWILFMESSNICFYIERGRKEKNIGNEKKAKKGIIFHV